VKPASFDYAAPSDVESALALLREHGDDAKVLAGGQSLVPMMAFRLARPRFVVDVNRVPGLAYVREEDGELAIGALTRHAALERAAMVRARAPLLAEAVPLIGHAAIRSRGTVGGSIVHADPSAELPIVMATLGARLVLRGLSAQRVVAARDFFVSYLSTAIAADELLVEVRLPLPCARTGVAFEEISRRHGDFALVAVATTVTLDAGGVCRAAAVGVGGVGSVPVVADAQVAPLLGSHGDAGIVGEVARAVSACLRPDSDLHASSEYRTEVAEVLVRRTLERAMARAREQAA
jgi:CO/xanthine dehydrogenase FAD-binding subunit